MELGAENENVSAPHQRLLERLRNIPGYTWDKSTPSFHSSYEKWYFFGFKNPTRITKSGTSNLAAKGDSGRVSPGLSLRHQQAFLSSGTVTGRSIDSSDGSSDDSHEDDNKPLDLPVVATVSTNALREERAYHIVKNLSRTCDPDGIHIAKPLDHVRLPAHQGDTSAIVVSIFEAPGRNALARYMDFGPEWYRTGDGGALDPNPKSQCENIETISLPLFLDFAIGATECLELLHYGQQIIHGEIRGDAFHLHEESAKVRIINFGSGLRSFEHGLTSSGWATLSKERDAKTKISYISPEQTGRMPAEPDTRTDIYSLGVLFWTLLTKQPAFDGETPMDIIQGVLGRRLPSVSSIRLDVPDVIGNIISKMTAKAVNDRYHSVSGLRHDLLEVQKFLGDGDSVALKNWKIGTKDVSSFFILPTGMIGRSAEHDEIVKVIDRVAKRHSASQKQGIYSISSGSSIAFDDLSSEASSKSGRINSAFAMPNSVDGRGNELSHSNISYKASGTNSQHDSQESIHSTHQVKPWERTTAFSIDVEGDSSRSSTGAGSLTSQRNKQKFRRQGRCEVISIDGAAGLGKSCLVQSVQVKARRRGYFASSKFDLAKQTAFGPVLKLLSSLFKQVFSENVTDTPFHLLLKQYVRPAWPMLHKVLDLPEFLLGPSHGPFRHSSMAGLEKSLSVHGRNQNSGFKNAGQVFHKNLSKQFHRRDSSPASSRGSLLSMGLVAQSSQDFLRVGSSTKSVRLITTFLDVLRLFAQHKFICFCLDDLQFADEESLELISQIVSSKLKMVIIITYRPDEILPERIKQIIDTPDAEVNLSSRGVGVTRVTLKPLPEEDITKYVSITMSRPTEDIIPLSAVIQAKSGGNPFYMREFMLTCHRKNCIWYCHRDAQWCYDIDRIFQQFSTAKYDDVLNSDFVTKRLGELPLVSRLILSWASLIGSSFSFDLVQKLLSGEFEYEENRISNFNGDTPRRPLSNPQKEAVSGLQAAIQAYIIVTTADDDRFRFAHDRYLQAAASLNCEHPKMHFIIAETLMKYYASDEKSFGVIASHVCESIDVINQRVVHRQRFRKVLFDQAQAAAETGARSTASKLYSHCFSLLQSDPWNGEEDVYYDETLSLFLRAAECYLYMSKTDEAMRLLFTIFQNARTPVDKAPAFVLQSRIHAQCGDSTSAFIALKTSLISLGIKVDESPTWEKCDAEFERLSLKIQSTDRNDLVSRRMEENSDLYIVGLLLVEMISAAFWSDPLTFFLMTNIFVNTYLDGGSFPQSGLCFLHMASIAISRFNMISFASDMGYISLELMDRWQEVSQKMVDVQARFSIAAMSHFQPHLFNTSRQILTANLTPDPYTLGRGNTIYSLFVGHVQSSLPVSIGQLESALEYTIQSGDRMSTILNFGVVALLKLFASEHTSELELFCQYGPEEIPGWQYDCRGGTILVAVRQVCRALQGKTITESALEVMSDGSHSTNLYLSWIKNSTINSVRPIYIYESLEIAPLFLYGHYQRAIDKGRSCIAVIDDGWSIRASRFMLFFFGLAIAGLEWSHMQDPRNPRDEESLKKEIERTMNELRFVRKKLLDWQAVSDVNYFAWSSIIEAQMSELHGQHGSAIQHYEKALDHAAANGFIFEEALGNYLLAGFFVRHSARRPAKAALKEAATLYRQFGAVGVARYIEEEHNLLLHGPTQSLRTADVGVQVDFSGDPDPVQYKAVDSDDHRRREESSITESKGDRIGVWQGGSARADAGSGLPALDMLDLTSILEGSQVISSVLQVDQLLTTMVEIILENCGAVATLAAIIVQEDDPAPGWSIAASGKPDTGAKAHIPGLPVGAEPTTVDNNIILYCTRFRETVFVPDLIRDERFSNVSESWWQRNPQGKSVIAIPITHGAKSLLGVLYLEGHPNAFTDRNLTVLQLLVNQIGISYSNALILKAIEKVSASNVSMVQSQKRALAKAKESEIKAKLAEAEALRNMKLAEEAAKAKSIFLANVSHELRTPLNGVIGNSELLRVSGELSKEQAEMSDSIRISADLLLTVINDILDFSRMEADRMELFNVAFNAAEMLAEVVRSMSYSNRDKKKLRDVEIKADISLPDTLIYGDPVRLHQVLGNLIGNSLKFTEKGSITVGARQESETIEHSKLLFWVRDTGIGVPSSQIDKLFKPFSQADASTARKYGGSGLGLSICKALIESMMHGNIEMQSAEDVGTTVRFSVTFPKADVHASVGDSQNSDQRDPMSKYVEDSGLTSHTPYSNFSNVPRTELRICIAEDNVINQKIAIQIVQKLGFRHVDAYNNGLEAVEGLRRMAEAGKPYHLVLMDCQMPVMDGYESTRLIRKDDIEAVRGILVIAMTASAIQGDREKCLDSGMNDYLAKPVRVHVLKKKLEEYLHQQPTPSKNLSTEAVTIARKILDGSQTPSPSTTLTQTPSPIPLATNLKASVKVDTEEISPKAVARGRDLGENAPPWSDARSESVVWIGSRE